MQTRERARVNKIKSLQLDNGTTITVQGELEEAAKNFDQSLFTAQDDT